jgi:hypothetical protein
MHWLGPQHHAQRETEHADTAYTSSLPPSLNNRRKAHNNLLWMETDDLAPTPAQAASPVLLQAPQHRHEPRVAVAHWAHRARLAMLEVPPSAGLNDRVSPEDRQPAHNHHNHVLAWLSQYSVAPRSHTVGRIVEL